MAIQYNIIVKDPNANTLGTFDDFIALTYQKVVNGAGVAQIVLHADHAIVSQLAYDCQVEIWRKNDDADLDWYRDFDGLFEEDNYETDEAGTTYVTLVCRGVLALLSRAIVGFPNGTFARSTWPESTDAATVIDGLVYYNASLILGGTASPYDLVYHNDSQNLFVYSQSYAMDPERITYNDSYWRNRVYVSAGEPTEPSGDADSYNYALFNVLEACQEVAELSDRVLLMDKFDDAGWLVPFLSTAPFPDVASDIDNPAQWAFSSVASDDARYVKTSTVIFAPELDNMARPRLVRNKVKSPTKVVVGGEGAADSRIFGEYSQSTTAEVREAFISATQATTTAAAQQQAQAHYNSIYRRDDILFEVRQTATCMYGRDYNLADRVTARYRGSTYTKRIQEVTVSVVDTGGGLRENIQIRMEDA